MSGLDLHKLANTPGFGVAAAELQKAGAWDKFADGGAMKEYQVLVTASMPVSKTVTVNAHCEEEAEDAAIEMAGKRSFVWDFSDECDDFFAVVTA